MLGAFGVTAFAVFLLTSCNEGRYKRSVQVQTSATTVAEATKCVRIYYDSRYKDDTTGRVSALYLENLIGHFKHVQQFVSPIEKYKKGDIDAPMGPFARCEATLYLATYSENEIPRAFVEDFRTTTATVAWIGNNLPSFSERELYDLFGVAKYRGIVGADLKKLDSEGKPGFYRHFHYLGETFEKSLDKDEHEPGGYGAAFDINELGMAEGTEGFVKAYAEHSSRNLVTPYILNKLNHWYVADAPFSYVHADDRYLIVADVLFDILKEEPLIKSKRPALLRYEDLHAELPQWQLDAFLELAREFKLKFALSVIPEFVDSRKVAAGETSVHVKLNDRPVFTDWIAQAIDEGGTLLQHGYTHQSDRMANPLGISGWDYEFWDFVTDGPMKGNSISGTLKRLEAGYEILRNADLVPSAWLTPHYMASPLDNFVIGQVFEWSIGGVQIGPFTVGHARLPKSLTFDAGGKGCREDREHLLPKLGFESNPTVESEGFMSAYEVYGDVYGQGLLPETAGYLNPLGGIVERNTVDDMIYRMKRNLVLRDAWGSYFFHPFMFNTGREGGLAEKPGDTKHLKRLLQATRDLGYEFVDVKEWIATKGTQKRPATVEIRPD